MKTKEFLINKLDELTLSFPSLKVSYFIDDFSNSNYIKILPPVEFSENLLYKKHEINIIIDFISKYPYEEIVFVSEDHLLELSNLAYEKEGELFGKNETIYNTKIWVNDFILDFNLSLNKSPFEIVNNYNSLNDILKSLNNEGFISPIKNEPVIVEQAGEISYALAA